jgi:hypothetical protein
MSSSNNPARLIVGGIYLLKALFFAIMLVMALLGTAPALIANPILGGLSMAFVAVIFGGLSFLWGSLGVGLLKGNRFALAIAIVLTGLSALGSLAGGVVVWFFVEAALFVGLLMSRDVRSAYGS